MTARALAQMLAETSRRPPRRATAQQMAEAVRFVRERLGAAERPPAEDRLVALYRIILRACSERRLHDLRRKDWRSVPWILWRDPEPPAGLPGLLDALFAALVQLDSRRGVRNLVNVYLRDYDPGAVGFAEVARQLRAWIPRREELSRWRHVQERFRLFEPVQGPTAVADAILASEGEVARIEREAGLAPDYAESRLLEAVHAVLGTRIATEMAAGRIAATTLDRVLDGLIEGTRLRFPGQRVALANALLGAWRRATPPEPIKGRLLQFFLRVYKDPRIHHERWFGVAPECVAVLRRWLAREALEQFFDVIDRSALDDHWRYRKKFWLAYFEKGVVEDAWIVLGLEAQRDARRVMEGNLEFGKLLTGQGAQRNHSVLLLRLDRFIITEWSHNGRCRVWPADDRDAPKFFAARYSRSDLITGSINLGEPTPGLTHRRSEAGVWQGKLADFIARKTNIRISRSEYMPYGR